MVRWCRELTTLGLEGVRGPCGGEVRTKDGERGVLGDEMAGMGVSQERGLGARVTDAGVDFDEIPEDVGPTRVGGGLILDARLGEVGGLERFRVNGLKPGLVGDEDASFRARGLGLEGLGKTGSAGTGGISSSSSSSLSFGIFFGRLRKKAMARDLLLPGDFPCDLFDDAERYPPSEVHSPSRSSPLPRSRAAGLVHFLIRFLSDLSLPRSLAPFPFERY